MKDNPSFLSRWSQRKTEQQDEPLKSNTSSTEELLTTENSAQTQSTIGETTDHPDSKPQEAEQTPPTDEDMPEIESLDQDSDFKQFFSPGVSEELRNLALRKLFLLPEFNIRDGLNDYDDDFSKMPELTKAVADKLRSWINEKEEDLTEELTKTAQPEDTQQTTSKASEEKRADQPVDKKEDISTSSDKYDFIEEDDLGDADLDG